MRWSLEMNTPDCPCGRGIAVVVLHEIGIDAIFLPPAIDIGFAEPASAVLESTCFYKSYWHGLSV
jgi:hypothetical protein